MLEYNEIKPRKFIVFEGEPFEILTSHVFRKQQRKPINAVKMRNLVTGKVIENSFHQSEKVEEAELERRPIKYLYENRGQYWFSEADNPSKRFEIPAETVTDKIKFIRQNEVIEILSFDGKALGIEVPIKVELKVTDAPPTIKGNTAQGGLKQITLETGLVINAPMFINEGDIVRVNTETKEYVERVN
ncbi:MAG: elongation factor P [Candidatus Paceibacterota bacterium]|jgi:elongation factor P